MLLFTGIPVIITHPTNEVINATTSITLTCKATGGGSIKYWWETSDIIKDEWMILGNSNGPTFFIRSIKSQKYRCVASNEAGTTRSNVSIIALMGKLFISVGIH